MSKTSLERLIGIQMTAFEMFENMLEGLQEQPRETITREFANAQLAGLKSMWGNVLTTHQEILSRKIDATNPYLKDRTFRKIQQTRDCILLILAPALSQNSTENPSRRREIENPSDSTESPAKLPRIELPRFSGNLEDWEEFADLFENAVHNRTNINDAVRLQYLKSCVSGAAADVIKDFKITKNNYKTSWNELKIRFSNPRYLVRQEIEILFNLKLDSGDLENALKTFINIAKRILRECADRGLPTASWDVWIVILLSSRIDVESRTEWESEMSKRAQKLVQSAIATGGTIAIMEYFPTFTDFVNFVERRCDTLHMSSATATQNRRRNPSSNSVPGSRKAFHTSGQPNCPLCSGEHKLFRCDAFLRKCIFERRALIAKLGLCFNCMGDHHSKVCQVKQSCRHCQQRHHSILHTEAKKGRERNVLPAISIGSAGQTDTNSTIETASSRVSAIAAIPTTAMTHFASPAGSRPLTILATAILIIESENGTKVRARALLDQGSEVSLITQDPVQALRLKTRSAPLSILGLGSSPVGTARGVTNITLRSVVEPNFFLKAEAFVLSRLSSCLPSSTIEKIDANAITGLQLADPAFYTSGRIDLILGADIYAQLLRPGLKRLPNKGLVAQKTALGWILSGVTRASPSRRAVESENVNTYHCLSDDCAFQSLERFWRLEEPPLSTSTLKPEEELCENFYIKLVTRDRQGRYSLKLPVKGELPRVAEETRRIAMGSMCHLRRKFARDSQLRAAYVEFMSDYENLGHMERIPESEVANPHAWYLPHHPVISSNRDSYKLRVVFDASRKTKEQICLNNYLLPGPALHLVLLNWRRYRVAFTADIVKMFRQIGVKQPDRDLQRIIWSPDGNRNLQEYRLTTVTYGTACAPFLAIRTLTQLALDEGKKFPLGARCLQRETYVDDIFTGADDILHARAIKNDLIAILQSAGISLDKWAANCKELGSVTHSDSKKDIPVEGPVKTLGVCWNTANDRFSFRPHSGEKQKTWTKRSVLSHIARLFDPLGWLAPVLITARVFMQDLCIHKSEWDDPLPDDLQERWLEYGESLATLPKLHVERWLGTAGTQSLQLHGFSDACSRAYAAAVYLRVCGEEISRVTLLSAKTKVAPIKSISVPNTELCGAVLLIELVTRLRQLDWVKSLPIFLWTDSEIVLAWLDKHPSNWKTFVANRVSQIQTSLPMATWSHVPTKDNPADIATRGICPANLVDFDLWWRGPSWLAAESDRWPKRQQRARVHHTQRTVTEPDFVTKFSSYTRLVRFIAYCWRFWTNCLRKKRKLALLSSFLSSDELSFAKKDLIKISQRSAFEEEIIILRVGDPLPRKSALLKLRPFLDDEGLLRVGGRLSRSELVYNLRHPPILPRDSHVSRLLILHVHGATLHGGPTMTTANLWKHAWILGCRRPIKTIIRNCVRCQRAKPRLAHQLMGGLPPERTAVVRPFSFTGLDYAGPFSIRTTKGRGHHAYKDYVALFVCFTTRAIHLELVSDLTTQSFLAAYRRFVSRRGIYLELVSDNATTFKGADAELRSLFKTTSTFYQTVGSELANIGTKWKFIPPNTPHYGGLWEAGVKSVKHHLRRTIGEYALTFEEFTTLLAEVEACLNSRPLCPLSSDPDDLGALTPAHFLHGGAPAVPPAADSLCEVDHCLSRFKRLQGLRNQLWSRWSNEYVQHLQQPIYNWRGDTRYGLPLEIGETLQILEECTGWYRGFSIKNRAVKGIFPSSYVYLKSCKIENEGLFESVIPLEDPVVREVTLVLREWGGIWKRLFVDRETYKFNTLRKVMCELLEWRRQLLAGTLTTDQTRELKLQIINKVDWGNRKLGLDLVPRQGAHMVDPDSMSVIELYHVHVQSAENSQGSSGRGTLKRKEHKKVLTHHLYFCMRDFGHSVGEDAEIYFSLYDAKRSQYISERFLVRISKEGFSNYVEKMHSNCTIFTDLGNADLSRDLYMVAHVMRCGRMLYSDSGKNKAGAAIYRRPHGVGVLSLVDAAQDQSEELELTFKVYQGDEKEFHQLHEQIIRNNKCSPLPGQPNYGIVVSFRVLHGELCQVRDDNPLLFKNICLTKKLGFSDVIMPGDVRNDLYLKLERGEFERGGKSTGKNIEVTVMVLDSEGQPLEGCLFGAAGMDGSSEYQSLVIYHHNSPSWAEMVRLAVPIDKFYGSHVRFEFRHCSTREKNDKKLFAFAFVRLMEMGGATLQDGLHELYIYKCEERAKLESLSYLSMPSNARELNYPGTASFIRSAKEAVFVQTLLCSTKLTQNIDLLSLLQWKAHPEKILEALSRVLRLDGEELVKFLQDILDALFAMFHTEDGNSTAHSGLVFQVLVSIFILLEESKFEHFKPVINAYISDHFAAALVYKGLISSVQHCTERVAAPEKQEFIMKCFRSLEYIFKFIIQSRLLYARATAGQYEDSFRKDIYCVFAALNKMLTLPYETVLSLQVALLISVPAVFEQLIDVLPIIEVTTLTSSMLDSILRDSASQLMQAKLEAIKSLVTSELFKDDESRNILLSTMCRHLRIHLARREELRTCTEILGEILSFMYKRGREGKVNNCIHHDVETLCLTILDVLIQTILIIINAGGFVLNCLVACLMGLLQLLDEYHYARLWEELTLGGERKPLKEFLLRVFLVLRELVGQEIFPSDWLVIRMQANNIILKSLQELAQPLAFKFLHGSFDSQLWSTYFNLAVAYLTQPSLQLEQFSEVKREKIVEKYGDMRVLMGFQILSMWSHLGEKKLEFIPGMVGPFLEVTLVPESELRKATLHIFFDMMECEQRSRGSFKSVESELIDKLDILISENKGDDEYRQLFNTILLDRVQSEDPTWKDSGTAFITSVTRLLERLLDYRSVIQGDENRDKRMSCTVNLLNFYKNEFNRKEMYLRYIYKLHDLHLAAENYTEAGFTMKLYADQLSWNSVLLPADHSHPQQPEWQRKEVLYHKIIRYFDKGKCWEKGIPLCKELATLYEMRLFDYAKLSDILKVQAKFLDNILTQLRPEPEYFRVGFYGLSFPLFVRNKLFIYRGLEYERIGAFTQRLQTEFPSAQILMKNSPPDETILSSENQYIQICNVKPIPEENSLGCGQFEIPERVVAFYLVNDVRRFVFDRPLHRGQIDRDNEFKSLWIERTTLMTEAKLPGILRWFEVIDKRSELLAPVQYACETMQSVERELRRLVAQYTAEPHRNINPFSMRLQGIIDANVMGGITKYQEAFLTVEFARQNIEMVPHVNKLKNLIMDQMSVLEAGLLLHGQIAPAGVQPLHNRLIERFTQLKQSLGPMTKQRLLHQDSIINSPLPPLPIIDKQRPATLDSSTGTRLSHADSDGQLDDEGFYTKVEGCTNSGGAPPPIPQREVRPRSVGYGTTTPPRPTHQRSLSKPLSPKLPLRNSLSTPPDSSDQPNMRTSWSEPGTEPAPPLPPRGCTPDKRDINSSLIAPPAPPKRLSHKRNTDWSSEDDPRNSNEILDLRDSGISTFSSLSDFQSHLSNLNNLSYEDFEPRTRSNDNMNISPSSTIVSVMNASTISFSSASFQEANPPPIPPKVNQDTPSAPSTLERVSNRIHGTLTTGHVDNYSVPKLQALSIVSDSESTI